MELFGSDTQESPLNDLVEMATQRGVKFSLEVDPILFNGKPIFKFSADSGDALDDSFTFWTTSPSRGMDLLGRFILLQPPQVRKE